MKTKILFAVLIFLAAAVATAFLLQKRSKSGQLRSGRSNVTEPSQSLPSPAVNPKGSFPAVAQTSVPIGTDLSLVPLRIRSIIDLSGNPLERIEAVRTLKPGVSATERDVLYAFLRERHAEDEMQRGQVLKNDLLDALCSQEPLPAGLRELLTDLFKDRNQHVVIRDYALQHLILIYDRFDSPAPAAAESKRSIQGVLWAALTETDSSIAGTALLGLHRLAERYPEFDRNRVSESALHLAKGEEVGDLSRITALQVCASFGITEVLPELVALAETSQTAVRISALGAIGTMGGSSELDFLDRIVGTTDERLKPAAVSAKKRIQERLVQKTGAAANL